jgi:ectoine hydroxylase-related dioxygenase (phytanoyl-CoA dioxygenase family)
MPILTQADLDFFHENGYLVVRNLIPRADCEAVVDTLFDFLGMDPEDPEDWYRPPLTNGGMVEIYQHQSMWNNRQNPRLHEVFSDLWGTEKLWVSVDRVNFKPPQHPDHPEYDHKGFIHWDTDTRDLDRPMHVQGVLYLADTAEDQGGFQCVPELYRNLREWVKTQPEDRDPRRPDLTGFEVKRITGNAGDFVIWHVLEAHGNGHNVSQKPRFAQFISMNRAPARGEREEQRQHRINCWENRLPPGGTVFPGDPREVEQNRYQTAELTPLGRKLLGVDYWE